MSNGLDLDNDIEHSEESDLRADFNRTVRNSQQNSKYISKQRSPVEIRIQKIKHHFPKYQ